jgi:hypothetical protein
MLSIPAGRRRRYGRRGVGTATARDGDSAGVCGSSFSSTDGGTGAGMGAGGSFSSTNGGTNGSVGDGDGDGAGAGMGTDGSLSSTDGGAGRGLRRFASTGAWYGNWRLRLLWIENGEGRGGASLYSRGPLVPVGNTNRD